MKSGWSNTVVSAIVGGVVGAVVAFVCGAFSGIPESVDKLKVGELIVSEKMMLWDAEKNDASLLIQNGGMLASTRVIAQQICGNAMLANCVLTTPDNPISPLDQCRIFTEMGSSPQEGGLLTIRSPDGGNVLSNPNGAQTGWAYTVAYDNQGSPICFFRRNETGMRALGQFVVPGPPPQVGENADPNGAPLPPQQDGRQMEMSQNPPAGMPMNPAGPMMPGIPVQDNYLQGNQPTHSAMLPTTTM